MRPTALLAALLAAGCLAPLPPDTAAQDALAACRTGPATEHVLYLAPGHRLAAQLPAAGSEPGNGFQGTFLDDSKLTGWLSDPVGAGLWVVGNVTLSFWTRASGVPAPVVSAGSGDAYLFFDQFGSDRSLQPAYATEYGPPYEPAGTVAHYQETLAMPPGGFVVERGEKVRVLLTDLTAEGPDGSGHAILFGGATPSQVRFIARCYPDFAWSGPTVADQAVSLPGNQGGVAHAVPTTLGVNRVRFPIEIPAGTGRLTIRLEQGNDANPAKDDVDVTLLDRDGREAWPVGSPYANEAGTLWEDNLAQFGGQMVVQVDSYSAVAYTGRLTVVAETARLT